MMPREGGTGREEQEGSDRKGVTGLRLVTEVREVLSRGQGETESELREHEHGGPDVKVGRTVRDHGQWVDTEDERAKGMGRKRGRARDQGLHRVQWDAQGQRRGVEKHAQNERHGRGGERKAYAGR